MIQKSFGIEGVYPTCFEATYYICVQEQGYLTKYCVESVLGNNPSGILLNMAMTNVGFKSPKTAVSNDYILSLVCGTSVKMITPFSQPW